MDSCMFRWSLIKNKDYVKGITVYISGPVAALLHGFSAAKYKGGISK